MDTGTVVLIACFGVPAVIGIVVGLITQADILRGTVREMNAMQAEMDPYRRREDFLAPEVNPTTGVPMVGDSYMDASGHPWGS